MSEMPELTWVSTEKEKLVTALVYSNRHSEQRERNTQDRGYVETQQDSSRVDMQALQLGKESDCNQEQVWHSKVSPKLLMAFRKAQLLVEKRQAKLPNEVQELQCIQTSNLQSWAHFHKDSELQSLLSNACYKAHETKCLSLTHWMLYSFIQSYLLIFYI